MEKKTNGHGGARPGSGRKKGTTDKVTIAGLLEEIENTNGLSYTEILAQDFTQARGVDSNLTLKYHNLIFNKLAPTLTAVETVEGEDAVQAKAQAFAEALTALAQSTTHSNKGK